MSTSQQVSEELDGRRGDFFRARTPDILNADEWKNKEWFTIREVMHLTQLNGIWVRMQVKDGRWQVKKDEKGRWLIARKSVAEKLTQLSEKDERRRLGIKSEYKDPPPRLRAVKIIRKQVKVDADLSKAERKIFLSALTRYEKHFARLYKERMDKIAAKKS